MWCSNLIPVIELNFILIIPSADLLAWLVYWQCFYSDNSSSLLKRKLTYSGALSNKQARGSAPGTRLFHRTHFCDLWFFYVKQGVIAGVFKQKGAAPWGITNAEKLQISVFLPNELSLEDWYAGVYGLPTVSREVSMMETDHLRKVAGYDFHDLRRKYDVRTMWGDLDP